MSTSVNRQTLRELLASGLGERIRFGHELVRHEAGRERVRLHFASGLEAEADLLVGADGVNSAVRRQHLPQVEIVDTRSRCIYGKTPLDESTLGQVPAPMLEGFTAIVGGQIGVAAGLVQFRQRPEQAAAAIAPGVQLQRQRRGGHRRQRRQYGRQLLGGGVGRPDQRRRLEHGRRPGRTEGSGFYLQYSAADNRWALSLLSADVVDPSTVRALSTAPPQLGTWTHLVGTYDAASGAMRCTSTASSRAR